MPLDTFRGHIDKVVGDVKGRNNELDFIINRLSPEKIYISRTIDSLVREIVQNIKDNSLEKLTDDQWEKIKANAATIRTALQDLRDEARSRVGTGTNLGGVGGGVAYGTTSTKSTGKRYK